MNDTEFAKYLRIRKVSEDYIKNIEKTNLMTVVCPHKNTWGEKTYSVIHMREIEDSKNNFHGYIGFCRICKKAYYNAENENGH